MSAAAHKEVRLVMLTVFGDPERHLQKSIGDPIPTLDQFHRAHESLWMRPSELAKYEHNQRFFRPEPRP
jgi:uncharacterized protein YhfF